MGCLVLYNQIQEQGIREGKVGDVGQRIQTFSYKMNKFSGSNVEHSNYS